MSDRPRRLIAIVGASSAIAAQCARIWAATGSETDFILVGRSSDRLSAVEGDLRVRTPRSSVYVVAGEMERSRDVNEVMKKVAEIGIPDLVLIAHGALPDQALCQMDLGVCEAALVVNGLSPVLFAEAFAALVKNDRPAVIAIIGSVAGDRGRKSNYVYGAAKGLVERYAQGMQHRLAHSSVRVVLVKPGPTDTPMTAHLKASSVRLTPVESVAAAIVQGLNGTGDTIYVPARWRLIMTIIRCLPRFVFNRLDI